MINTAKDFSKNVGSNRAAQRFVNQISRENKIHNPSYTCSRYRNGHITEAWGENNLFSFRYNGVNKYLSVTYKDGRGADPKNITYPYLIIWVEGLTPTIGEKISKVTNEGFEYTTKMSEALRIRKEDRMEFGNLMREHGIAEWVLSAAGTFCSSSYAPKGTLFIRETVSI